jgi:hypothetical protein
MNNYHRNILKKQLRNLCAAYIREYDAGENPYRHYQRIRTICQKLKNNWKDHESKTIRKNNI